MQTERKIKGVNTSQHQRSAALQHQNQRQKQENTSWHPKYKNKITLTTHKMTYLDRKLVELNRAFRTSHIKTYK